MTHSLMNHIYFPPSVSSTDSSATDSFQTGMNKDKNVKKFECPICNSVYTCQSKLKWHVKLVHQKKRPCNCSFCDATYSNEYDLWRHISSIHEREKSFICNLSQERYSQNTSLNRQNNPYQNDDLTDSHMFMDFKHQERPIFAPQDLERKDFDHKNKCVHPYVEMTRK